MIKSFHGTILKIEEGWKLRISNSDTKEEETVVNGLRDFTISLSGTCYVQTKKDVKTLVAFNEDETGSLYQIARQIYDGRLLMLREIQEEQWENIIFEFPLCWDVNFFLKKPEWSLIAWLAHLMTRYMIEHQCARVPAPFVVNLVEKLDKEKRDILKKWVNFTEDYMVFKWADPELTTTLTVQDNQSSDIRAYREDETEYAYDFRRQADSLIYQKRIPPHFLTGQKGPSYQELLEHVTIKKFDYRADNKIIQVNTGKTIKYNLRPLHGVSVLELEDLARIETKSISSIYVYFENELQKRWLGEAVRVAETVYCWCWNSSKE